MIDQQSKWANALGELEAENLKPASYDHTLIPLLGDVAGQPVLDYGAGPGVLALALKHMDADIRVWDISAEMRERSGEKVGQENVYSTMGEIPPSFFSFVICNLVLCIVPEDEVRTILGNIRKALSANGRAFIGFCNPLIFNVAESQLDYRYPCGCTYHENHSYKKVKKEGNYEIIESHRPIEWYVSACQTSGLETMRLHFTPQYDLNGVKIQDFVIFELKRAEI